MDTQMKQRMADTIRNFRMPRYAEIPDVGLYLEQTVNYINGYLSPLGCSELTGSMVSNYVKKGLIAAPVKKRYAPEQIAYLFFVALAKNLMRMEDIDLLISIQRSSYTLPVAYDYLCQEFENMLFFFFGITDVIEEVGVTESDEKMLLRGLICSAANVIYLHNCFDQIRGSQSE